MICGTLTKIAFLYAKMGVTLWYLTKLESLVDVQHFTRSVFGILIFYAFIYEPIAIAIYSAFFSGLGGNNMCTKITGMILIGNFHPNIVRSVIWALNN